MGKRSWEDFVKAGQFDGSWEEMQRWTKYEGVRGKWHDMGFVKRFAARGLPETSVLWWPDTGDLMRYEVAPRKLVRRSRLDWRKERARRGEESSGWCEFSVEGDVFTLPELVIRCPEYFFAEIVHGDADIEDIPRYQLAEIMEKVCAIRMPKTSSKNARIVHKYTRSGAYCGFEVSTRPVETYRQRGTLILADYIDLETHDGEWWRPDVVETPVCSLIKAVDGDASRMWDRGRCEAFFDDESNFIPLTGKYIPGLSFWRDLGAPLAVSQGKNRDQFHRTRHVNRSRPAAGAQARA